MDKKEDHSKLGKRTSLHSTSSWNGKDTEDGQALSPIVAPTAGSIHALMFGSTYTRKNGNQKLLIVKKLVDGAFGPQNVLRYSFIIFNNFAHI